MAKNNLTYATKKPLCDRVAFVDGLARCGKFLTCRVLSHLNNGDHWQYPVAIEHLCYLIFNGQINEEVAAPFVQLIADEQSYNRIIGRFLNTREDDASSIFQCPDHVEYIRRSKAPSGIEAVEQFNDEGRFPTFQLHNALASGPFIFNALPHAKVVHICRHPVDQIYKWFERGWGQRETEDPLSFVPIAETPAGSVPWFAHGWAKKFITANPMERALEGVLFLQDAEEKGISALNEQQKKQLHRITLEHLVTEPDRVVGGISEFLQSEPHEQMKEMLLEERVPRVLDPAERQNFFREIAEHASDDKVERLVSASRVFEENWGLDPFQP